MPLEIRETKADGGFVVLEPVGRLESKTSPELDRKVVALLAAGERRFVVDLASTEYVSSAGLRVLLMLGKKVSGGAGRLVLCGLNPQVREVFDVAGLGALFVIRASRAEALTSPDPVPGPAAPAASARPVEDPFLARVVAVFGPVGPAHEAPAFDRSLLERAASALLGR